MQKFTSNNNERNDFLKIPHEFFQIWRYSVTNSMVFFFLLLQLDIVHASNARVLNLDGTSNLSSVKFYGASEHEGSGYIVTDAGDINGDNISDIIISGNPSVKPTVTYALYGGDLNSTINLARFSEDSGIRFIGRENKELSGYCVSNAGDVDGDGIPDILIGAPAASPKDRYHAGKAYLIYGHALTAHLDLANLTISQGVIFEGANINDELGTFLAPAGDINGDGFDDVLIGAPSLDIRWQSLGNTGLTYLIYGGGLEPIMDLVDFSIHQGILFRAYASGLAGSAISSTDDINGDGLSDIMISAPYAYGLDRSYAGITYIVFGGLNGTVELSSLSSNQGIRFVGASSDMSGISLSRAGDFNGDGITDYLIGAPYANDGGKVYLVYGGTFNSTVDLTNLTAVDGVTFVGAEAGGQTGASVSTAGDVNGDGLDDILIGANWAQAKGRLNSGLAYLVYGGMVNGTVNLDALSINQGIQFYGDTFDYLGSSVSSVGDINNDGFSDFMLAGGTTSGTVYLIYGKAFTWHVDLLAFDASTGLRYTGIKHSSQIVTSILSRNYRTKTIAPLSDINGDGLPEILIGASAATPQNRFIAGQSYIIFGNTTLDEVFLPNITNTQGVTIDGGYCYDYSVYSVSAGGDFNGDDVPDLIFGLAGDSTNMHTGAGQVLVAHENSQHGTKKLGILADDNSIKIHGTFANERLGADVSFVGDINGDGFDDILAGSQDNVYIIYGGVFSGALDLGNITSKYSTTLNLGVYKPKLGFAGDVNGDSINDMLIGDLFGNYQGRFDTGVTYLVFGSIHTIQNLDSDSILSQDGFFIEGGDQYGHSGNAVAGGCDINEDGYDDFIIAAPDQDFAGKNDVGFVYLIYGKNFGGMINLESISHEQGVKFSGNEAYDHVGSSVACGGDFNGDSISDILIGASGVVNGVVYLIFDAQLFPLINLSNVTERQGVIFNIGTFDSGLGDSVSFVKDANGDGASDILLGVPRYNELIDNFAGTSFLIHGSNLYLNNNHFLLFDNATVVILTSMLDARNHLDETENVRIRLREVLNGHFENLQNPGIPITLFYQSDVTEGSVKFVPDGSGEKPSFYMMSDLEWPWIPRITFDYVPKIVNMNPFHVAKLAARIPVTSEFLLLDDPDNSNEQLEYFIQSSDHIVFERGGIPLTKFSQSQVNSAEIAIVHDGSSVNGSFLFIFTDGLYNSKTYTGYVLLTLPETQNELPILERNHLTINEAQQVTITEWNLKATDIDHEEGMLIFNVYEASHGQFEQLDNPNVAIIHFSQQDIWDGQIVFVHDGSDFMPSYSISVSDNVDQSTIQPAEIVFTANMNDAPIFSLKEWVINQGQLLVLNQDIITASDLDNDPTELSFQVREIQHAEFRYKGEDKPLFIFKQQEVNNRLIELWHDGSSETPTITLLVNDGQTSSEPQKVNIRFIPKDIQDIKNESDAEAIQTGLYTSFAVASAFLCFGTGVGIIYTRYRKHRASQSRQGDEYQIPREVYEILKVKSAGNFKSLEGSQFVEQINGLVEIYVKRNGGIPADKTKFAQALSDAIFQTCNLTRDRFKQTALILSEDESVATLKKYEETIVDQTERCVTYGTGSVPTIPLATTHHSVYAATEMGVFANKSPRKSQRSPRSQRHDDEYTHKRRSRSASQGGSRSLSQSGLHGATRSRSNSRKSQRATMVVQQGMS